MDISSSYLIWPEWHWIKSYLIIFTVITAEGSLKMNLIGHVSKFRWLWRQVVAPVWQGPSLEFFQMVPANVIHLVAFWWNNEARNIFWCFQTLTATLHCIKHFIQNCIKCTTHKKRQKHEGQNDFLCMKNTRPLSWYSRTQNPTEMKKMQFGNPSRHTHIWVCGNCPSGKVLYVCMEENSVVSGR